LILAHFFFRAKLLAIPYDANCGTEILQCITGQWLPFCVHTGSRSLSNRMLFYISFYDSFISRIHAWHIFHTRTERRTGYSQTHGRGRALGSLLKNDLDRLAASTQNPKAHIDGSSLGYCTTVLLLLYRASNILAQPQQ
jgi:hypothetical protein